MLARLGTSESAHTVNMLRAIKRRSDCVALTKKVRPALVRGWVRRLPGAITGSLPRKRPGNRFYWRRRIRPSEVGSLS